MSLKPANVGGGRAWLKLCFIEPIISNNNYNEYAADPTGRCGHRPMRLLIRYLCQLIVVFEPMFWASDSTCPPTLPFPLPGLGHIKYAFAVLLLDMVPLMVTSSYISVIGRRSQRRPQPCPSRRHGLVPYVHLLDRTSAAPQVVADNGGMTAVAKVVATAYI